MPPVEDHAVHEKTVQKSAKYEACQGKKRQGGYSVLSREYRDNGRYELTNEWVPDNSSKHCRYMDYATDAGCEGCPQPKDEIYIEKMRLVK